MRYLSVEVVKFGLYVTFPLLFMAYFGDPSWYEKYVAPFRDSYAHPELQKNVSAVLRMPGSTTDSGFAIDDRDRLEHNLNYKRSWTSIEERDKLVAGKSLQAVRFSLQVRS